MNKLTANDIGCVVKIRYKSPEYSPVLESAGKLASIVYIGSRVEWHFADCSEVFWTKDDEQILEVVRADDWMTS